LLRPALFTVAVGCISFYLVGESERRAQKKAIAWNSLGSKSNNKSQNTVPSPMEFWNSLPEHQQTMAALIAINSVVFFGWRFFPDVMSRYFLHTPYSNKVYTLVTSMFSHQSGFHFLFNMIALWSFGGAIHQYLGRENFLAFYLTSGVTASLSSHIFHTVTKQYVHSLGASGALFGLVGLVYTLFPTANLYLFFLISVQAKTIIPIVAAFDVIGLTHLWTRLFGFRLDHAAHLGGLLSGLLFSETIFHPEKREYYLQLLKKFDRGIKNSLSEN